MAPFLGLGLVVYRGALRRRLFVEVVAQAAIVAALVMPWVMRNAVVMGKPTLATLVGGHTFWGAHNDATFHDPRYRGLWITISQIPGVQRPLPTNELEQEAVAWRSGFTSVREHVFTLPQLCIWKLYRLITPFEETANRKVYWAFAAAWIATVPGLLLGWRELRRRDPALHHLIALQLAATVLCVLVFYGAVRFRHAMEPLLMMVAAVGLSRVAVPRLTNERHHLAAERSVPQSCETASVG
jgi:hypothetical protein